MGISSPISGSEYPDPGISSRASFGNCNDLVAPFKRIWMFESDLLNASSYNPTLHTRLLLAGNCEPYTKVQGLRVQGF